MPSLTPEDIPFWVVLVGLIASSLGTVDESLVRQKRFLLFPRANPARLQLIGGFGIPVDLQLESITVGYVFKSVYLLPWNSSHWIPQFLDRHEQEIQRTYGRRQRDTLPTPLLMPDNNFERYDAQWQDLGSEPLQENTSKGSRWLFYHILEQLFDRRGFDGRSCVLRAICECSEAGFTHTSGLVGELLHIAFTPSCTEDVAEEFHHEQYKQAEKIPWRITSHNGSSVCAEIYGECTVSLLNTFSSVFE